jgi:hypothetical protein
MLQSSADTLDDAAELSRLEARLPPLLSVIAGMVDFTGFFTLGHIFTAHVTGNIVLATLLLSTAVRFIAPSCWRSRSSCWLWRPSG